MDSLDPVLEEEWLALRRAARQMLFHTGAPDAPFAFGGTYFLLIYADRLFAITARHVVRTNVPEKLLLSTSDKTPIPPRILEQIGPSDEASGEMDLVVYDLDVRHYNTKQRRRICAYRLDTTAPSRHLSRYDCDYALFGYPLRYADLEYGARTTRTESQQWCLRGRYRGNSEIANCHILALRNDAGLEDLNGLSGSPVFALATCAPGTVEAIFAGLVLRGSAASGRVHFLDAGAIRTVLDRIVLRPRKKLPKRWWGGKTRLRRRPSVHE